MMNDPTDSYSALAEEEAAQQGAFDDRELADAVVALGVGESTLGDRGELYRYNDCELWAYDDTAEIFVRDWRVAGAMMENEKIHLLYYSLGSGEGYKVKALNMESDKLVIIVNESLPRAITEACVEALK